MTTEDLILATVRRLEKKIDKIERGHTAKKEYIPADEVKARYNVSKKTLQLMRNSGKLSDYTHTKSGRNFRYSVNELEKIFAVKLKLA